MQEFKYQIQDELGIHARPAGMFVKEAMQFTSDIQLIKDGKSVDGKRIIGVMSLGAKCGDEITLRAEGSDEAQAISRLQDFLQANL